MFLFLKWDHIMYIVLQLFWTVQLWYVFSFHVRHESLSNSYIIVGCTVIYVIIPLLLDIWVVWNVSDREHRPSSSEAAAFLVGPLGLGCFLTLIPWDQEVGVPFTATPSPSCHHRPWKNPAWNIMSASTTHFPSWWVTYCCTPRLSPSVLQDFSF